MRKRMMMIVAFAFIVALAPAGSARAQTCCVCTVCLEDPQTRCFADIDDSQCADFCTAQECDTRDLLERTCFAPLCPGFPIESQPAPALGPVGIALGGLAAGLAGMSRLLRRGKRPSRG